MSAIYRNGEWYGKGGSGSGQTIQVDALPTASATEEGNIYQYIGDTENGLVKGLFYVCIEDDGSYLWKVSPTDSVEITQADYDLLSEEEKTNGTTYYITDAVPVSQICYVGSKFNRSDIYKDTEEVIGSYLGKPLYQKVFTFNSELSVAYNAWTQTDISLADNNIETIISCMGFPASGKALYPLLASSNSGTFNNVALQTPRNATADAVGRIILQYTKTTDSANSAIYANENDYSTDETIVGKWIDGKPLYQRTVDCGAGPNATTKSVPCSINNLDKIVDIKGIICSTTSDIWFKQVGHANSTSDFIISIDYNNGNIRISSGNNYSNGNVYVTLQYTKTTD